MTTQKPKVSIITPAFNSSKYIQETIDSVMAQSYDNFEMIVVDDCSTDDTIKIIKLNEQKDRRIKLVQLSTNSGAAIARNTGIELAKGKYLTFLDADDYWFPNFIQRSIEAIDENQTPFVFSSYKRYDENLEPLLSDFIVPEKVNYHDILKSNSISCLTAFVDISILGKRYMPLIRKRQDMGLWCAFLKSTDYAIGISEPLAIYRIRKNSLSRNKLSLIKYQWEFYFNHEKLGLLRSFYYLVNWAVRGYLKYSR